MLFFRLFNIYYAKTSTCELKKLPHEMGGLENKQSQLADRKGICI